jgi:hypothetical protein
VGRPVSWGQAWVRRPGCSLTGRFRLGSGDAALGHFEAEGAEPADVVGDLAADIALALVVVRAEVFIPHTGVGQQLVVDLQLGVADPDLGFGFAAAAGQPPVAGAFAGLGLAGRDGGLAGDGGQVPVALIGLRSSSRMSVVRPIRPERQASRERRTLSWMTRAITATTTPIMTWAGELPTRTGVTSRPRGRPR